MQRNLRLVSCRQCYFGLVVYIFLGLILQTSAKLPFNDYLSFRSTAIDNSFPCTELCAAGSGIVNTLVDEKPPQALLNGDLSASDSQDYAVKALTTGLIVPLVFAVLTFLVCLGFTFGRACCNTCGGRIATESYRKINQTRIRILLVFWSVCILILFALIVATNHSVSRGIDETVQGTDQVIAHYQSVRADLSGMTQPLNQHITSMNTMAALFEALPDSTAATTYKQCFDDALPRVDAQAKIASKLQALHNTVSALPAATISRSHLNSLSRARSAFPSSSATGLTSAFSTIDPHITTILGGEAAFTSAISAFSIQANTVDAQASQLKQFFTDYLPLGTEAETLATYVDDVRAKELTLTVPAVLSTLKGTSGSPMSCPDVRTQIATIYEILTLTQDPLILQAAVIDYYDKFSTALLTTISAIKVVALNLETDIDGLAGAPASDFKASLNTIAPLECDNCDTSDPQNSAAYIEATLPNLSAFRTELNDVPSTAKTDIKQFSDALALLSSTPDADASTVKNEVDTLLSDPTNYDLSCLKTTLPHVVSETDLPIDLPASLLELRTSYPYVQGQQDAATNPTGLEKLVERLTKIQADLGDITSGLTVAKLQSIVNNVEEVYTQFENANNLNDIDEFAQLAEDVTGRIASLAPTQLIQHIDEVSSFAGSNTATVIANQLQNLYDKWNARPGTLDSDFSTLASRIDTFKILYYLKDPLESILTTLPESGCTASDTNQVNQNDVDSLAILEFIFTGSYTTAYSNVASFLSGVSDAFKTMTTANSPQNIEVIQTNLAAFILSSNLPPRYSKDVVPEGIAEGVVEEYTTRLSALRTNLNALSDKITSYSTAIPSISSAFDAMPDIVLTAQAITVSVSGEVDPASPTASSESSLIYTPLYNGYAVLIPAEFDSTKINAAKAHVDLLEAVKQDVPTSTFTVDQSSIMEMVADVETASSTMGDWLGMYHSGRRTFVQQVLPFDEQRLVLIDTIMLITLAGVIASVVFVIRLKHKPMMFLVMVFFTLGLIVFLLSAFHLTLAVGTEGTCKDTGYTVSTLVGNSQIQASTLNGFLSFLDLSTSEDLVASELAAYQMKCQGTTPDIITQLSSVSTSPPSFISTVALDGLVDALDQTLNGAATTSAAFNAEIAGFGERATVLLDGGTSLGNGLSCQQTSPLFKEAVDKSLCTEVASALSLLGCLLFLLGLCIWPGILLHICAFKRFNRSNLVSEPGGPQASEDEEDSDDEEDEGPKKTLKLPPGASSKPEKDDLLSNAQPEPYVNVVPIAHGYELSQLKGFKKRGTAGLVLQSPVVTRLTRSALPDQPAVAPPQQAVYSQPK